MAKSLASPFWLLVVWLLMGAMALCGALCYGELAARFPEAGGGYVYLREAYGSVVAFLYGWMAFLVLDPGLTAAFAVGLASYAAYVVPLSPLWMKLVAVCAILTIAALNIRGVRLGANVMQALTVIKLGLLALIAVWGFGRGLGQWSNFKPFVAQHAGAEPLVGALAAGLVGGFFAFGGWWDASKLAGEVRDPARTLPRALAFGVMIVTFVYIVTSAVFMYLVPLSPEMDDKAFAAQVGKVLFGEVGGQVFASIVVISVFGSLAAFIMAAPRVYYAMARDGLFFKSISQIHARFGTPARAIALQAVLASVIVAFGTFDKIVAYFFFVTVIFIALSVAGLILIRRKQPAGNLAYKTAGYPLTPLVFLVLVTLLLVLLAMHNPFQAFLGVGVVVLGAPVYYLLFRR